MQKKVEAGFGTDLSCGPGAVLAAVRILDIRFHHKFVIIVAPEDVESHTDGGHPASEHVSQTVIDNGLHWSPLIGFPNLHVCLRFFNQRFMLRFYHKN